MNTTYSQLFTPQFISGRGSISFIATLGKKKIGVIRGGRSLNDELKATIEKLAADSGAEVRYLAQIRNEPFIEDIFRCMDAVREFEPDMILAIGGGSVLDTAKAIHLFYENPEMTFEQATIPYSLPALGKKAVHISVPTTSGTGSETTSCAVFIDPETKTKKLLLDNTIIPHYAILDANTTDSLPASITIATALDALTHAIESSTALNASMMTKAIAIEAAVDILENIKASAVNGEMTEEKKIAREKIHIASAMAGVAITNSCTGLAHSYDHPGPAFSMAHGNICGLMLPYTMKYVGPHDSYATIAKRLGYRGNKAELTQALIDHLLGLMKELNLKTCFKEMGIDAEAYKNAAKVWAEISLPAFATVVSPAGMTYEKGIAMYDDCYEGTYPTV